MFFFNQWAITVTGFLRFAWFLEILNFGVTRAYNLWVSGKVSCAFTMIILSMVAQDVSACITLGQVVMGFG